MNKHDKGLYGNYRQDVIRTNVFATLLKVGLIKSA